MQCVEGIHKISTATVIFYSLDFTLQFRYPFILELKQFATQA